MISSLIVLSLGKGSGAAASMIALVRNGLVAKRFSAVVSCATGTKAKKDIRRPRYRWRMRYTCCHDRPRGGSAEGVVGAV